MISQNNQPIAFYSHKLAPAQTRYTTTERELLSIVETLKEFRNILLGQEIKVYTDHKNLTYKNFNTERVMRWRLIIEEFGPELIYIPGQSNIVAKALSRLPIENDNQLDQNNIEEYLALDDDDLPASALPISFQTILKHQQKDKNLIKDVKSNKLRFNSFHGGRKTFLLICNNINKIVIPKTLQNRLVDWYHTQLCHPGQTRTYSKINQNFTWSKLEETVKDICKRFHTCQMTKKHQDKYGKLPMKNSESTPWDIL